MFATQMRINLIRGSTLGQNQGTEAAIVELGAGTTDAAGYALAVAHPHAHIVLTDLPEVRPLLQSNA